MAISTQSPTSFGGLQGKRYNPVTGQLEDITTGNIVNNPTFKTNSIAPYTQFRSQNVPANDAGASMLSSDLLSGLGKATQSIPAYTAPEKINVGKAQSMPVEYYQSQIEDLSKPLTAQYDKARANLRGDQAARGTIYDSQGRDEIIDKLETPFLEQLGSITRGVQQQRMQNENQNQQFNITNEINEGLDRRQLGTTSQLQGMGINANLLNSLLGYGADRYGTEAGLFSDIYGADTDFNKTLIQDMTERTGQNIDLLGLTGYTESPQTEAYNNMLYQLGLATRPAEQANSNNSANRGGPPTYRSSSGQYAIGTDGKPYVGTQGGGWRRLS